MSDKSFITLPRSECLVVYKQIIENSDRKWETAQKLAEIGDYAGATSMSIISIEELVKAMLVFMDGTGFEFRSVEGMNTIFRNHQIRYLIAYGMFVLSIFGDDLISFLMPYRERPQDFFSLYETLKNNPELFQRKMKFYSFRKLILFKREFTWFSQIDIFRQDSLYCDYDEQLKNPINISELEYREVHLRLEKVRKIGKGIMTNISSEEMDISEQIKKMQHQFKEGLYYEKIADGLKSLRQSRNTPFEHIAKRIERM